MLVRVHQLVQIFVVDARGLEPIVSSRLIYVLPPPHSVRPALRIDDALLVVVHVVRVHVVVDAFLSWYKPPG